MKDCEDLKSAIKKYKISEDDVEYEPKNDQDLKRFYRQIENKLKSKPDKNYVIFHLFSCHGLHKEGTQHVVTNDYNEVTGFY